MPLENVQRRIFEDEGFQRLLNEVVVSSIASQFKGLIEPIQRTERELPWRYLLTVASILAKSDLGEHQDAALRIAQQCLENENSEENEKAAAFVILDDMGNSPAIKLAQQRELIPNNVESRSSMSIRARFIKNRLESTIQLIDASTLRLTKFQQMFWEGLDNATWVSVSAPTSAGKSFVISRWLINSLQKPSGVTVYLVPTRALVTQVCNDIKSSANELGVVVKVATIPLPQSINKDHPTILVFTQERMHLFLTQGIRNLSVKHLIVDEAQKIGDRHRGVLLQHVIEMLIAAAPNTRVTFVSPMTENPDTFFRDAPGSSTRKSIRSQSVAVNQNLLWVTQKPRKPKEWTMKACYRGELLHVGDFSLKYKPTPDSKRLPFVAKSLSTEIGGSIVYVNRAVDAESVALQLYDLQGEAAKAKEGDEIALLSELVKDVIHKDYLLAKVLSRGVAFHYGNMPQLVRTEVERLFSSGEIKFLVCTSTLIEGVNTSCKTISVRGPKKGSGNLMSAEDFWNLAGRAGRLGKEFQGNIVCVDADKGYLWEGGEPPRRRKQYIIERTTDDVLANPTELIEYCSSRAPRDRALKRPDLEYVSTYLMLLYKKYGALDSVSWASSLDPETLKKCNESMSAAWSGVEIPLDIVERSPGISPMAMQVLLEYFRIRTNMEGKSVHELLPSQPGSDDAAQSFAAVIGRCAKYLNANLGPPGKRSYALAVLVTRWMRGLPLSRLIIDRIKIEKKKESEIDLPGVIRSVLDDVERIARFEAPRTITAYIDVLKFFLLEIGKDELIGEIEDVGLFLEMGMSIPTQITLVGLGLSRSTAIRLSELIADDAISEIDLKKWLETRTWESSSLPALVKREIERVLAELVTA